MGEVYGVVPKDPGVGRPPTRKPPQTGWQYLPVVKPRQNGRVVGTTRRVVFGNEEEVLERLGRSTAYVERTHLTMRLFNGRLVRKTRAFSKQLEMDPALAAWEDRVYNLARPLKTLRLEVDAPWRLVRLRCQAPGRCLAPCFTYG